MDRLGPYSVAALQRIIAEVPAARAAGVQVHNASYGGYPAAEQAALAGHPVVLLWAGEGQVGHFILLHWLPPKHGRPRFEVYDPLGSTAETRRVGGRRMTPWDVYMDDPAGASGAQENGGGLRPLLQALDRDGVEIHYNPHGPQARHADSCGLWCILRACAPNLTPTEFAHFSRR